MVCDVRNEESSEKFDRAFSTVIDQLTPVQLKTLAGITLSFSGHVGQIGGDRFFEHMKALLGRIGKALEVSRVYLFEETAPGEAAGITCEWCAPGIEPQLPVLGNLFHAAIPALSRIQEREGILCASDIAELPPDLRGHLELQGIRALAVIPLAGKARFTGQVSDGLTGLIGFDDCTGPRGWSSGDMVFLRLLGGIVATLLERRRRQAEREMAADNYRSFFESIDDFLIVVDPEGRIAACNPAVPSKLGFTPEALRTMGVLDLHPEGRREEAATVFREMLAGVRDVCTIPLIRSDGETVPVESRVWQGTWNGKPVLFGISKDLTALQAALDKFNTIFRSSPVPMALADPVRFTIIEVNEAFERITCWNREAVLGRTPWEVGLFADGKVHEELSTSIQGFPEFSNFEYPLHTGCGTVLEGLFSGTRLHLQGQDVLLVVMTDITEQNRLRADIEDRKERLVDIIEATGVGIWEWDLESGLGRMNEQWANMLGYTLDELKPTTIETWWRLVHPDDLPAARKALACHLRNRTPIYECELRLRSRNGSWVWVSDKGRAVEWNKRGRPVRMFGTQVDITKRKLEEMELQHALNEATEGAQKKSLFFAQITHDIKTPLNIIHGLNQLLLETELDQVQRDYVRKIRRAAVNLLGTVGNLLDYARIEAGKFISEDAEFSLRAFLETIAQLFEYESRERGLPLHVEVDPDLPDLLFGDQVVLRHILQNLLENAFKYTRSGAIALEAALGDSSAPVAEAGNRVEVIFRVIDTGIGIPAEKLQAVFELFSRGDKHQRTISEGAGLGLAICRELTRQLGGSISLESESGSGTSFTLTIPYRRPDKSVAHRAGAFTAAAGRGDLDQRPTPFPTVSTTDHEPSPGRNMQKSPPPDSEAIAAALALVRELAAALKFGEPLKAGALWRSLAALTLADSVPGRRVASKLDLCLQEYRYDDALRILAEEEHELSGYSHGT